LHINSGPSIQERLDHPFMAILTGKHQCCPAILEWENRSSSLKQMARTTCNSKNIAKHYSTHKYVPCNHRSSVSATTQQPNVWRHKV